MGRSFVRNTAVAERIEPLAKRCSTIELGNRKPIHPFPKPTIFDGY